MEQIRGFNIFVGTKEEHDVARFYGMDIVCALNRCDGYVSHQSVVGWKGRGCNPENEHYLYKETDDGIYLNMVDAKDPKYFNDKMIDAALAFMDSRIGRGDSIFVYCSKGESRSPSLVLMWLLSKGNLPDVDDVFDYFKGNYYPGYNPGDGVKDYIKKRWIDESK